jgi:hypothetical protein
MMMTATDKFAPYRALLSTKKTKTEAMCSLSSTRAGLIWMNRMSNHLFYPAALLPRATAMHCIYMPGKKNYIMTFNLHAN